MPARFLLVKTCLLGMTNRGGGGDFKFEPVQPIGFSVLTFNCWLMLRGFALVDGNYDLSKIVTP